MTKHPRYEVILYWSEPDQSFIAEVPELSGCAADGASYQEALAAVEVVINEWIETAQELGREIPKPSRAVAVCLTDRRIRSGNGARP